MARRRRQQKRDPEGVTILLRNRRAFHDYQISERIEAGMVLLGSEVKSLREGRGSLAEGYAEIRNGEAWLVAVQIKEYPWANQFNHEPVHDRKLLLSKREIRRLAIKTQQRGFTLVPLSIYDRDGKLKVELGLAAGRRQYEKREVARAAEASREIDQELRRRR